MHKDDSNGACDVVRGGERVACVSLPPLLLHTPQTTVEVTIATVYLHLL